LTSAERINRACGDDGDRTACKEPEFHDVQPENGMRSLPPRRARTIPMAHTQLAPVSIEFKLLRSRFVSFYCGNNYKSAGLILELQFPAPSSSSQLPAPSSQLPAPSSQLRVSFQFPVSSFQFPVFQFSSFPVFSVNSTMLRLLLGPLPVSSFQSPVRLPIEVVACCDGR